MDLPREHFVLLFLDVVLYLFGQHLDLGIEHLAIALHALDLDDKRFVLTFRV